VAALLENVGDPETRSLRENFEPIQIIVPNRNLETYLTLEIARSTGIAVNLSFDFWERFLSRRHARTQPPTRLIRAENLHAAILHRLEDPADLPPTVRRYLDAPPDDRRSRDQQSFQLAGRLARLFEDYSLSRPELLREWRTPANARPRNSKSRPISGKGSRYESSTTLEGLDPDSETMDWQRQIWLDLFGPDGWREKQQREKNEAWIRFDEIMEATPPGNHPLHDSHETIHLFGFSYIAPLYQDLLVCLARHHTIHLYGFQPGPFLDDEFVETAEIYHPMLRSWGTPGREYMEGMSRRKEVSRQPLFVENNDGRPVGSTADFSIQACPSIRREVEVVANEIWSLIGATGGECPDWGRELKFNEIAVIIADSSNRDLYQTHLVAAFEENHGIPVNLIDTAPTSDSRMLEAVKSMLDLPGSKFGRLDILNLLVHPALMNRFPDSNPTQWMNWCDRTHILWGVDREDQSGSYLERDIFNWAQGIKRLILGSYMTSEAGGLIEPVLLAGVPYRPEYIEAGQETEVATFAFLVKELIAGARAILRHRGTLESWSHLLISWVSRYLSPRTPADDRLWGRILSVLTDLPGLDPSDQPLGYEHAASFVRLGLEGIAGDRGTYLTDGVVISSFLPMRPIPFEVAFIVGLGEGRFPATGKPDDLDLAKKQRKHGDVSESDRDRYLFLETLVATRQRAYLSYVSRNPYTGDPLEPSALLGDLMAWHRQQSIAHGEVADAEALETPVAGSHPLRRYHPVYFESSPGTGLPSFLDRARTEYETRRSRPDRTLDGKPDARRLAEHLRSLPLDRQAQLDLIELPKPEPGHQKNVIEVSLYAVRRFLECPLQGWASLKLGLTEVQNDAILRTEDEPFSLNSQQLSHLLSDMVEFLGKESQLPSRDAWLGELARLWGDLEITGDVPTGLFGRIAREQVIDRLDLWSPQIETLDPFRRGGLKRFEIGRAGEEVPREDILDYLELKIRSAENLVVNVRIHGRTGIISNDRTLGIRPTLGSSVSIRHHVGPLVDWHVLNALSTSAIEHADPEPPGGTHEGLVLRSGAQSLRPDQIRTYRQTSSIESRRWLGSIIRELLYESHAYFFPIDVVPKLLDSPGQDAAGLLNGIRASENHASRHGPIPDPESFPTPTADRIERILSERFSLFRETRREVSP